MKAKLSIFLLLCMSGHIHTQDIENDVPTRAPQLQQPGILGTQYATAIKPTDVKYGTYEIEKPGYYFLTADIVFNPDNFCPADGDKPCASAVINILSDNVILDLNTHSISQDPSSSFPDFPLIKLGGRNYDNLSDTRVYAPKNVTIKNGSLIHSTGYGIYGQNNAQIAIYDLIFVDHANAAIQLENLQDSRIEHITIHGSATAQGNVYGIYLRDNSNSVPFWTSPGDGDSGPQSVTLKNIHISGMFTSSTLDPLASLLQKLECAALALSTDDLFTAANTTGATPSIKNEALDLVTQINDLKAELLAAARAYPQDDLGNMITQAELVSQMQDLIEYTQETIQDLQELKADINSLINPTMQDAQISLEIGYLLPLLEDVIDAANMVIVMCGDPAPYDYINGIIYGANENGLSQIYGAIDALEIQSLAALLNSLEDVTSSVSSNTNTLFLRIDTLKKLISQKPRIHWYTQFIDQMILYTDAFAENINTVSIVVSLLGSSATQDDHTVAVAVENMSAATNNLLEIMQRYRYQWHHEWHAYAIRITQGKGITCEDIHIVGVRSENTDLDGLYSVGIALDGCQNTKIIHSSVSGVEADSNLYGTAVAYGLFGSGLGGGTITQPEQPEKLCTGNIFIQDSTRNNTNAQYSFGWYADNANSNVLTTCKASSQQSSFETKGFFFVNSHSNLFESCESYDHSCTPTAGTDALAIGYDTVNGYSNIFKNCAAYNMQADIDYINSDFNAELLSVGFRLGYTTRTHLAERGSVIDKCIARCNRGGHGQAVGILLDQASYCTITNNQVSGNEAMSNDNSQNIGNGYGIWDRSDDTTSLIIQNFCYVNQNGNYKVSYSGANEQLPVVQSTYGDMTALFSASPWNNVSLNPSPGFSGFDEITE
jgi:hypothetical protein